MNGPRKEQEMKIALYGATGTIGQRILSEALGRGHEVTAIVRDPSRLTVSNDRLTVVTGDAQDPANVAALVAGQDAVIGSISGRRDGEASLITKAAESLIQGVQEAGAGRLLWVGGAGTLEVAPGVKMMDTPEFPEAYRAEADAGAAALAAFRAAPAALDWTYLSPPAVIAPGERTGKFQVGGDQLVVDSSGSSHISAEDYAVALIDEIETPKHIRQRFTVGY